MRGPGHDFALRCSSHSVLEGIAALSASQCNAVWTRPPAVHDAVAVVGGRRRRLADAGNDAAHHGLHADGRRGRRRRQHLQRLPPVVRALLRVAGQNLNRSAGMTFMAEALFVVYLYAGWQAGPTRHQICVVTE